MRKCLILLFVFAVPSAFAAPVWTWVDSQGQVHYSDRPVPGARQIDLPSAQGFPAPSRAPSTRAAEPSRAASSRGTTSYRAFNIVSPAPQETLWNIGGNLTVRIELQPALEAGHQLDVYLDGQRAYLSTTSLQLTVPNVFRGTHSLEAVIIDAAGREVQRSPAVPFIVQATSIQNPQNPLRSQAQGRGASTGN
jgi:hypothetical protein